MTRPTQAEVDAALELVAFGERPESYPHWKDTEHVLAAEVIALLEELADAKLLNETQLLGSMKVREELEELRLAEVHTAGVQSLQRQIEEQKADSERLRTELATTREAFLAERQMSFYYRMLAGEYK
jgi:hypothetical protein